MASLVSAHHLLHHHSEHSSVHSRTWSPSVHGHIVSSVPHSCSRPQKAALLLRSAGSAGLDGCSCAASHQGQLQQLQAGTSPLACGSNNCNSHHAQQHRGNSSCATGAGGNWALAACSNPATAEAAQSLGWNAEFYNTYRLGEVMGHGSFGTVHRAIHRQTGTSYAVKVLQKSCSKRGMQLDAIKREVDTWQQAQRSKYVAKLEGLFEDEENAYIVQELCTGGTLRDHLHSQGCCSEREAASVMHGVLDLLVECHKRSICYGDLKPANIMFSGSLQQQRQPQVRAIDFGCSHSAQGRVLTQTCGSPLYMAPEVALQRYGVGVDVWSAGVMLYQMLTGRLPFWPKKTLEEVAKLPGYEILAAIRTYEIQFPRVLWADITPQAKDLVARMLDRNPATRITASQALQHPWLSSTLGFTPTPSGDSAVGANNVVEWVRGQRGSPLRPVPISPGKVSGSCGPLSPQKPSPLRAMLSGELPASMLVADMNRAPMPVMVPAAE